jgi:dephospho-CoA kinase
MSQRRSLSFAENEKELLDYFDENGKSDIAKMAMNFYKNNKDKLILENITDILRLISMQPRSQPTPNIMDKLQKMLK